MVATSASVQHYTAPFLTTPAMVHLSLSRGADTSLRDNGTSDEPDGFVTVEIAAPWNAIGTIRVFVAHGVVVGNSKALFLAARETNVDVLKLLLDKSSSCIANIYHQQAVADALSASAKDQSSEVLHCIVRKLERELDVSTRTEYWQSALDRALLAIFDGDDIHEQDRDPAIQIIGILEKTGASINTISMILYNGPHCTTWLLHNKCHESS